MTTQSNEAISPTEVHRRAALSIVEQLVRDFDATAPKVGDRRGWRKFATFAAIDSTALRQLVGYLDDLEPGYHARPFDKLHKEYNSRLVGHTLSDMAVGKSPEEIAALVSEYDRVFPVPLDDPREQRRVQRIRKEGVLSSLLAIIRRLRAVRETLLDLDAVRIGETTVSGRGGAGADDHILDLDFVTLNQLAGLVKRSKRTLENYLDEMPRPRIRGRGGKPSEWAWSELRPWAQEKFGRVLPEKFPAHVPAYRNSPATAPNRTHGP